MPLIDTFDRANAALSSSPTMSGGGTWVVDGNVALAQIVSNQLAISNIDADSVVILYPELDGSGDNMASDDHEIAIDLVSFTRTGASDLFVRLAVLADITNLDSGYGFDIGNNNGTAYRRLIRVSDSATIGTPDAVSTTSGRLRLRRQGSNITAYVDDVQILSAVDATQPTGLGNRGVMIVVGSAGGGVSANDVVLDNFGADVVLAAHVPPAFRFVRTFRPELYSRRPV